MRAREGKRAHELFIGGGDGQAGAEGVKSLLPAVQAHEGRAEPAWKHAGQVWPQAVAGCHTDSGPIDDCLCAWDGALVSAAAAFQQGS